MESYALNDEPLYDQAPGQYLHVTPDETVPQQFDNPMYFQKKSSAAEGDANYLAVQPDWLQEQWDLLSTQPWFRGFQSREDASHELRSQPYGSFVVRVSQSEPGHYAISAIQHKGMDHMLILPSYAGPDSSAPGCTRYRLGTYSRDLFNTVPKLIAYYIDHEYIDVRRLQGVVHEEQQAGGYMDVNPNAPSWNQGEITRDAAEAQLRGQPTGAFILRTKRGTGYVLSMAVPAPKDFMHHLITVDAGSYMIDGVPVGAFRSVEGLIDTLQDDTLSCILYPLVDIFGGGSPGGHGAAAGVSQYDTAGDAMAQASAAHGLYDAVPNGSDYDGPGYNIGHGDEPVYDQAQTDTGYLETAPASDYPVPEAAGNVRSVYHDGPGEDSLYSEEAYGGQVDPLADDYNSGPVESTYDTAADVIQSSGQGQTNIYGDLDEDL